jgi:hypothetical protein
MSYQDELPEHTIGWLNLPGYKVHDIIASTDLGSAKRVLQNIARHTNRNPKHPKYGKAWLDQKAVAQEIGVSPRTVWGEFDKLYKAGAINKVRIRKGKGKSDQFNEYWLMWDAILALANVAVAKGEAPANDANDEHEHSQKSGKHSQHLPGALAKNEEALARNAGSTRNICEGGFVLGLKGGTKRGNKQAANAVTIASQSRPDNRRQDQTPPATATASDEVPAATFLCGNCGKEVKFFPERIGKTLAEILANAPTTRCPGCRNPLTLCEETMRGNVQPKFTIEAEDVPDGEKPDQFSAEDIEMDEEDFSEV